MKTMTTFLCVGLITILGVPVFGYAQNEDAFYYCERVTNQYISQSDDYFGRISSFNGCMQAIAERGNEGGTANNGSPVNTQEGQYQIGHILEGLPTPAMIKKYPLRLSAK